MEPTPHSPDATPPGEGSAFRTTLWSVVIRAANPQDGPAAEKAMNELCRTYWPAIYAYIRRDGQTPEDAADFTQEFLARLAHKGWLQRVDPRLGRFRSFLLAYLKGFLSDQRDKRDALKRGGGKTFFSLEAMAEEERELARDTSRTPDECYDARWARVIASRAMGRLREDYLQRGKLDWFEQLTNLQGRESGGPGYAGAAATLGTTEQAIKNAMLRLRERYGQLLREEIAGTVNDPGTFEDEVRHFLVMIR